MSSRLPAAPGQPSPDAGLSVRALGHDRVDDKIRTLLSTLIDESAPVPAPPPGGPPRLLVRVGPARRRIRLPANLSPQPGSWSGLIAATGMILFSLAAALGIVMVAALLFAGVSSLASSGGQDAAQVQAQPLASAAVPAPAAPANATALHTQDQVANFAALAATRVMTYSFSDYTRALSEASRSFTGDGWKGVQHALNDSGTLASLVADRGTSRVTLEPDPKLVSFTPRHGQAPAQWTLAFQASVQVQGDDRTATTPTSVTVRVVENADIHPVDPALRGTLDDSSLGVDSLVAKARDPVQAR